MKKKKAGQPRKPEHLKAVSVNSSLPYAVAKRLSELEEADGSASRGLRIVATEWFENQKAGKS